MNIGTAAKTNNTRRGGELEKLVMASQSDAQGRVVVLEHIRNFAKRIPNGRGGTMLIEQASPYDFAGTVFATGRAICFDTKRQGNAHASFQLNNPKVVKPHQIEALERQHLAGAIAGLLVESERVGAFLWLPANELRRGERVQWDDAAWINLGSNAKAISFRVLIEGAGQ